MSNTATSVDHVFRAIADPTRRRVVERLSHGPATVSELASPFQMALPSFLQHLGVLEGCGVVRSHKLGRVRTYRLEPDGLDTVATWLDEQRAIWERRLDQLHEYLLDATEEST